MKKTFLSLAVAALALGAAQAQTIVNIGGSTAGRTAVHNNIVALLGSLTYAYAGTSGHPSKATRAIYSGTYNGQSYIVRTYWQGSVEGITPIVDGLQSDQLMDVSVLSSATSGGTFVASPTLAPASASTTMNIGYSDIFASTVNVTAPAVEDEVAVITFKWYANEGSAGIANLSPSLVNEIYGSSESPLSMFTGDPDDAVTTVFPIGRNSSSGTRGTAMAVSGYGNVVAVDQYTATVANGVVTALVPAGNGGFGSGSSVKGVMNATYSGGVLIGYLGASDFAAEGVELTWCGQTWSTANIQNGKYDFWGYLHMNRMNTLDAVQLSFYDGLKYAIIANPLDSGVLTISSMNVGRSADGAPIFPL